MCFSGAHGINGDDPPIIRTFLFMAYARWNELGFVFKPFIPSKISWLARSWIIDKVNVFGKTAVLPGKGGDGGAGGFGGFGGNTFFVGIDSDPNFYITNKTGIGLSFYIIYDTEFILGKISKRFR